MIRLCKLLAMIKQIKALPWQTQSKTTVVYYLLSTCCNSVNLLAIFNLIPDDLGLSRHISNDFRWPRLNHIIKGLTTTVKTSQASGTNACRKAQENSRVSNSPMLSCPDGSERDIGLPNMEPQLLTGSMPLNTSWRHCCGTSIKGISCLNAHRDTTSELPKST